MTTATQPAASDRRKGPMERIITAIVDGIIVPVTGVIPGLITSGALLVVFAALWIAFTAGLVANQGGLDQAWTWIRELPLLVQGVVWLLFLPVVAGLWVWETSWPLVARLVIVVALAGWNLAMFVPRAPQA